MKEKELFNEVMICMEHDLLPYLGSFASSPCRDYKEVLSTTPDIPHRTAAALAMRSHFSKKYVGGRDVELASQQDRDNAAWQSFIDDNQRCRKQNKMLKDWNLDVRLELVLQKSCEIFQDLFFAALDDEDSELLLTYGGRELVPRSGFSTGPGVCNATKSSKHRMRNVHDKYSECLVFSTDRAVTTMKYLSRVAPWARDLPTTYYGGESCTIAEMVPKSDVTSRLIGPSNNGDLLLSYPAEAFLRRMYRHAGMTLSELPQHHQALSRIGSRMRSSQLRRVVSLVNSMMLNQHCGSFYREGEGSIPCTIDMKGGSNVVGTELVRRHAPLPLFNYLADIRPTSISWQGKTSSIEAMALMGNGYCFPLQTLIFFCLCKATCALRGDKSAFISVFGDDIIVPHSAYNQCVNTLEGLQMVVNRTKSFRDGSFKESCGGDFYDGYNVKPIQFDRLNKPADIYVLVNRLIEHGTHHSILYKRTVECLLSALPIRQRRVVPVDFDMSWGLRVPETILPFMEATWRKNITTKARSLRDLADAFSSPETRHYRSMYPYTEILVRVPVVKPATLLRDGKKLRMFDVLRCRVPLVDYKSKEKQSSPESVIEQGGENTSFKMMLNGNRNKLSYSAFTIPYWDSVNPEFQGCGDVKYHAHDYKLLACYMIAVMGIGS